LDQPGHILNAIKMKI